MCCSVVRAFELVIESLNFNISSLLMSWPYMWKPDCNLNSDYLPLPKTLVACEKIHLLTFRRTCFCWVMYMIIEPNSVAWFLPSLVSCQVLVAPYAQWIREDRYEGYV